MRYVALTDGETICTLHGDYAEERLIENLSAGALVHIPFVASSQPATAPTWEILRDDWERAAWKRADLNGYPAHVRLHPYIAPWSNAPAEPYVEYTFPSAVQWFPSDVTVFIAATTSDVDDLTSRYLFSIESSGDYLRLYRTWQGGDVRVEWSFGGTTYTLQTSWPGDGWLGVWCHSGGIELFRNGAHVEGLPVTLPAFSRSLDRIYLANRSLGASQTWRAGLSHFIMHSPGFEPLPSHFSAAGVARIVSEFTDDATTTGYQRTPSHRFGRYSADTERHTLRVVVTDDAHAFQRRLVALAEKATRGLVWLERENAEGALEIARVYQVQVRAWDAMGWLREAKNTVAFEVELIRERAWRKADEFIPRVDLVPRASMALFDLPRADERDGPQYDGHRVYMPSGANVANVVKKIVLVGGNPPFDEYAIGDFTFYPQVLGTYQAVDFYVRAPAVGDYPWQALIPGVTVSGGVTVTWQYWDGAAWQSFLAGLPFFVDETENLTKWGAVVGDMLAIPRDDYDGDGTDEYIIRAQFSTSATVTLNAWPRIPSRGEIGVRVDGSEAASVVASWRGVMSSTTAPYYAAGDTHRLLLATRRRARGEKFSAFLSLSGKSDVLPAGALTITPGVNAVIEETLRTYAGARVKWTPATAVVEDEIMRAEIAPAVSAHYDGTFRVIVRGACEGILGNGVALDTLYLDIGDGTTWQRYTPAHDISSNAQGYRAFDFGTIDIPAKRLGTLIFRLVASVASAAEWAWHDIVLVPADEVFVEITSTLRMTGIVFSDPKRHAVIASVFDGYEGVRIYNGAGEAAGSGVLSGALALPPGEHILVALPFSERAPGEYTSADGFIGMLELYLGERARLEGAP